MGSGGAFGSGGFDGGKDNCTVQLNARGKPRVLLLADRSANTRDFADYDTPWWKAVNDGLNGVVGTYGNVMSLGYRSVPVANSMGCMGPDATTFWDNDVSSQLNSCSNNGACISSSYDVPLLNAVSDAVKDFRPQGTGPDPLNFIVPIVGSLSCAGSCGNQWSILQPALQNAQWVPVLFGNALDGNSCIFLNITPSHSAHDLVADLMAQMKSIAQESLCRFRIGNAPGVTFNSIRVTVNGTPFTLGRDQSRVSGWDFDFGSDLRIYGDACRAIVETTTMKPVVMATVLDARCNR